MAGPRFRSWRGLSLLPLVVLGGACVAYGYWIEPYWPAVTRTRIPSARLTGRPGPLRIVHISDVHSDPRPRLEERLPGRFWARPEITVIDVVPERTP